MKYLLVGGAEDVGKTGAIRRLTNYLVDRKGKGFENISPKDLRKKYRFDPQKPKDFMAILSSENYKDRHIAINSATDNKDFIKDFKKSIVDKDNKISIIISSIRDINVPKKNLRQYFVDTLEISKDNDDIVIELPLTRIPTSALKWYENNIDIMLKILVEGLLNCPVDNQKDSSNWWWLVNFHRQVLTLPIYTGGQETTAKIFT
jgi:hypothetical protein